MAHMLTVRQTGFVEFAYAQADGQAWHKLGQAVPDDATTQEWTRAAGMDWRVKRSRLRYATGPNESDPVLVDDSRHVLFRSDNRSPLGVVSPSYNIVQPGDVMAFFEGVAKRNGFALSAAGTLQGGRRFWATAKIGEAAPVSFKDKIGGYLLLSTSCDGSLSTEARLTTVRVVCANTLAMARAGAPAAVRVPHRSSFDPQQVQIDLGLTVSAWEGFRESMLRLANTQMLKDEAEDFTAKIVGAPDTSGFNKVMALFHGAQLGADMDGVRNTRYGMLQAVTEYADHHVRARSAENRFLSAQWGGGDALKRTAYEALSQ